MKIIRKGEIKEPVNNAEGELFFEMIGRGENLGNAKMHSLGHVVVLDGHSTKKHYHPNSEETYYIIKGNAKMIVEGEVINVTVGDVILILPNEDHQLIADNGDVEAIVVCAPAWEINNTIYIN